MRSAFLFFLGVVQKRQPGVWAFPKEGLDGCGELPVVLVHGLGESQGDLILLGDQGDNLRQLHEPGDVQEEQIKGVRVRGAWEERS